MSDGITAINTTPNEKRKSLFMISAITDNA